MSDIDWREKIAEPFLAETGMAQSPIEGLLLGTLSWLLGCLEITRSEFFGPVTYQHKVGNYKIDIAIVTSEINLAIECDGHAFHEKTKEQASRDKQRKRFLTAQGWTVIEFTGSEIWRNPFGCVEQIVDILISAHDKALTKSAGALK